MQEECPGKMHRLQGQGPCNELTAMSSGSAVRLPGLCTHRLGEKILGGVLGEGLEG